MTWVKTSDEKPKLWEAVWAYHSGYYYAAYLDNEGVWRMDEDCELATTPTHWMPLPEPPK